MKALIETIERLNTTELRDIRDFYKIRAKRGGDSKRQKLLQLILKGKVKSDKEAARLLYNKTPDNAYANLKSRLKSDIVNLLLLQDSKVSYRTPSSRARLDCRRLLNAAELLLSRGAYFAAIEFFNKASKLADNYELYNEKITINGHLISFIGNRKGKKYFDKYSNRLYDNYEQLGYLIESKKIKEEWALPSLTTEISKEKYLEITAQTVDDLRANYLKTDSAQIGYWYYQALTNYFLMTDTPNKALESAKEFLDFVKTNKSVYSNTSIANINFTMSVILLNISSFRDGAKYGKIALKKFSTRKGIAIKLKVMKIYFLNLFFDGKIIEAKSVCKKALNHKQINSNDFLPAQWLYYLANVCFMEKQYEKSFELLQKNSRLMKDKTGWLLGYKMLEMLNLIELQNYDLFSYKLEAFRKLLHRIKEGYIKRIDLAYQLLKALQKHQFNFKEVSKKEATIIRQLQSNKKPYDWRPDSYELIRVEEYILSKADA